MLLRPWYCCFNHAKVCIRISFCIQTSCKTLNGIKRSSFIDTCVIGEFNEPLRNQSGKYSYTWVFVKCIAFNEFIVSSECLKEIIVGLRGESCKLCSLIYVDRVLFNKISFMKTISVLVLLQRNVYVQRQKSTLFHFENTKMLTFCHNVFELRIQSKLESVFCRTLWKGFGNTQEDKMFLSLCNVECIYFWWFSKHGWNLLFRSHQ